MYLIFICVFMLFQVSCLTEKIEAIKLSNTADISEVTHEISNVSFSILNCLCD